jgi:hypothetical protein
MTYTKRDNYLSELERTATSLKEYQELTDGELFDIGIAYINYSDDDFIEYLIDNSFVSDMVAALIHDDFDTVKDEWRKHVINFIKYGDTSIEADYDEQLAEARLYDKLHPEDPDSIHDNIE